MDWDVAIAGAGPAGLAFGILAARRGYSTVGGGDTTTPGGGGGGGARRPAAGADPPPPGVVSRPPPAAAPPFQGPGYAEEKGSGPGVWGGDTRRGERSCSTPR